MSARIAICDYGMGNLRSVEKALEKVGAEPVITRDTELIASADGTVLPGVGAFPKAMANLRELGFEAPIRERVESGRPTLGICLGFQLLFERSEELEGATGLRLLPGPVTRIESGGLKVPHIGWALAHREHPSPILQGLDEEPAFYFVHSFAPRPAESSNVVLTAEYGERFACAVQRDALFGVQFHPEKSSSAGLRLLANFAAVCDRTAAPA